MLQTHLFASLIVLKDEINCQDVSTKSSHILSARPRERQTAGTDAINLGPNYSQAKRQWWSLLPYRTHTQKNKQLRKDELKKEVKPGRKKTAMFCEGKQTLRKDTSLALWSTDFPWLLISPSASDKEAPQASSLCGELTHHSSRTAHPVMSTQQCTINRAYSIH